jgi:hypothetical protein
MRRKANYALLYMLASMQYVFGVDFTSLDTTNTEVENFEQKLEEVCSTLTEDKKARVQESAKEYIKNYRKVQLKEVVGLQDIDVKIDKLSISSAWDNFALVVLENLENTEDMKPEEKLKEACRNCYDAYKRKTQIIMLYHKICNHLERLVKATPSAKKKQDIDTILSQIKYYQMQWHAILQDGDKRPHEINLNKTTISIAWNAINSKILTFLSNESNPTNHLLYTTYEDLNEFSKEYFAAYKAQCPQPSKNN